MDIATAAEVLAKRQKMGEEAVSYAVAIKVEALRQLGQMLKETERAKGQLLRGTKMEPREDNPTLAELGLDKKTSKLAQDVVDLPDEEVEKIKSGIVNFSLMSRMAKQRKDEIRREALRKEQSCVYWYLCVTSRIRTP